MKIEHIKSSELITNKWSGGTTTQLAIYPKEATYQERNFLFRISTATVESEESMFTKLPGVSRKIMILDGEIKIEHQNHYSKILKKFEQDSFEGDWDTKSFGKAIDFNLMTTGNTQGIIEAFSLNNSIELSLDSRVDFYIFYIYSGNVNFSIDNKKTFVNQGDLIQIYSENKANNLKLSTIKACEIILAKIRLN
jgi:environmental stress-induced protein Ves